METPTATIASQSPVLHRQVMDTLQNIDTEKLIVSPDTTKLIPFNGYYSLGNTPGAFFAIDANMSVSDFGKTSSYFINLILSLDGKTSYSIPFSTGTFDGTTLIQENETLSIHLTLARAAATESITATCKGTVQISSSEVPIPIQGSTYNNPIDSSLFAGTFYLPPPTTTPPSTAPYTEVLVIGSDNSIMYDYGSGDGILKPVTAYLYNMNMYYFTFDNNTYNLIMGTAGTAGLACNNIIKAGDDAGSRSLQTITSVTANDQLFSNANSEALGAFSGYYPLTSIHPAAFFAVLGQYTIIGTDTFYSATIVYSFDGKSSTGYSFGTEGMSFEDNVLTIVDALKNPIINLTFKRTYTPGNMSLATISGMIMNHKDLVASSPFNPVPLSAFGGVAMTDTNSSLTIVNDSLVTYTTTPAGGTAQTTTMDNFIYVPLMYILANPWLGTTTVLSLGTSGINGTACIVIDVTTKQNSFLFSIPNP
jgi:hypothetical protein